jgi:hypothetical protein
MSRSYRNGSQDNPKKGKKFAKREASSVVRRYPDLPSGGAFKKVTCQWDICDYRSTNFRRLDLVWPYWMGHWDWCREGFRKLSYRDLLKMNWRSRRK